MNRIKTKNLVFSSVLVIILLSLVRVIQAKYEPNMNSQQYVGDKNHEISIEQAVKFIQNFKANPGGIPIQSLYFNRNVIGRILNQQDCAGLRFYFARQDDNSLTLVVVGTNSLGNDMENGILGELAFPCPPYCSESNQLNR